MIYQWYSGSDTSKEVPRRLTKLNQGAAATSLDDTLATLRDLLRIETDPNWRGYLLSRIGSELLGADRREEGIATLLEAETQFDPLLPTICDLVAEYCDALFSLIVGYYSENDDFAKVAALATAIVADLPNSKLSGPDRAAIHFYQGFAFEMLAKRHSLDCLNSVALASYLKWHRLNPEEPACLEHLAYSYFKVGDMERSGIAARMCLEVEPGGEIRERVEKFLRDHGRQLACGKEKK
jgi:tetratricopeptide (TPR) repeat protein